MNDFALLQRIKLAKDEREVNALITEAFLQTLPPSLKDAVFLFAIPHWFDEKMVASIWDPSSSEEVFGLLIGLPSVEAAEDGSYVLHALTRQGILDILWSSERNKYLENSKRIAGFFEKAIESAYEKFSKQRNEIEQQNLSNKVKRKRLLDWLALHPEVENVLSVKFRTEFIYNKILENSTQASKLFREQANIWYQGQDFSFSNLEALVRSLKEHLVYGQMNSTDEAWVHYYDSFLMFSKGHISEAVTKIQNVLDAKYDDEEVRAELMAMLGMITSLASDYPAAIKILKKAREMFGNLGDQISEADQHWELAKAYLNFDKVEEAEKNLQVARSVFLDKKHYYGIAKCHSLDAGIQYFLSDWNKAEKTYELALDLYQRLDESQGEANTKSHLGALMRERGELTKSRAYSLSASNIYEAIGDRINLFSVIAERAQLCLENREYDEGFLLINRNLTDLVKTSISSEKRDNLVIRAYLNAMVGNYERAFEDITLASNLGYESPSPGEEANFSLAKGVCNYYVGNYEVASDWFTNSLNGAKASSPRTYAEINKRLGQFYFQLGNLDDALLYTSTAIEAFELLHPAYLVRARIYCWQLELSKARQDIDKVSRLLPNHPLLLINKAEHSLLLRKGSRAKEYLAKAREIIPNDPLIYYGLAFAYAQLNSEKDALTQLERGIKLSISKLDIAMAKRFLDLIKPEWQNNEIINQISIRLDSVS